VRSSLWAICQFPPSLPFPSNITLLKHRRNSETRVGTLRKHYTKAGTTTRGRRPCTKLTGLQFLWFRSSQQKCAEPRKPEHLRLASISLPTVLSANCRKSIDYVLRVIGFKAKVGEQ